jgi:hypothetical protein
MKRPRPGIVLAAALAATAAALSGLAALTGTAHAGTTAGTTTAGTAAKACRAWTGQHPPYAVWLTGVVALSPCDVWATGVPGVNTQAATVTDLLHWNGATWTLHTSDTVPASLLPAPSVTATSANDVWVAGSALIDVNPEGLGDAQSLIAHWNGTALSRVTSPDPGALPGVNMLSGISATTRNNAWAAGFYSVFDSPDDTSQTYPLAVHWNGSAWTQVPAAIPTTYGHPSPFAEFSAVQARCGCAPWAVGDYDALTAPTDGGYRIATLTERWTDGAWRVVASPNLSGTNLLTAVSADSSNDAWAVGHRDGNAAQTLAEHWNGHAWKIVPSPSPGRFDGKSDGMLLGVAALSPRDAWAVGTYFDGRNGKAQALLLRWNGTSWRQVALPHFGPKGEPNVLNSISASSAGNVIAAGYYSGHVGAGQQALLLRVP